MTPEKIQELRAIDEKVAQAVIDCDAAYLALKEAISAYNALLATIPAE